MTWSRGSARRGGLREQKEYLTALDSAIGDADHGINMDRGFQAVLAQAPDVSRRATSGRSSRTSA